MPVIRVENLSKAYRLGQFGGATLREELDRWWARVRKRPDPKLKIGQEHLAERFGERFWALRDVSFEAEQGEVLGIIGRNGSGKSTVLKILSQVTAPTEGVVKIKGRVASLLEVGTGFHPELTGRENIFLNGAILGMTKREIERKFDEIVAFSEVEQFIDTPVKRYSSGMYVRLAFAVAAHLEPEILIVDEVLAVGDAAFQRKCLGKMGDVAQEGRTVLFVSHNMASVQQLCGRAMVLRDGVIAHAGATSYCVGQYLMASTGSNTIREWRSSTEAPGSRAARLLRAEIRPCAGSVNEPISVRTGAELTFTYQVLVSGVRLNLSLAVLNAQGLVVFNSFPPNDGIGDIESSEIGTYHTQCTIPGDLMNDGHYSVDLLFVRDRGHVLSRHEGLLAFDVADNNELRGDWHAPWPGVVRPRLSWKTTLVAFGEASPCDRVGARQIWQ